MERYRLDKLGWFQFESLVQSLLKAELGFGVEAWGGHSDLGRDAYAPGPLEFPGKGSIVGPFVFQAKFVEGANGAGAKPGPSLLRAIGKEAFAIESRVAARKWLKPRSYVLLTNAPVDANLRAAVQAALAGPLEGSVVTTLGSRDICAGLDNHPELRKSFPELLSLRDLDTLLGEVVNRDVIERSKAAIAEVREIVPTFVQTAAYRTTWSVLRKHGWVVLDGPPEMGKTAIARMVGLAQLTQGWAVIECRGPDDLFATLDRPSRQVFVADDAFGRTEYDPTLGRYWERDLPRVLRVIDEHHWLIWTSRRHILMRALREMDLSTPADRFPEPAEIIVSAEELTTEEKARILYRHAKHADLSLKQKIIVKQNAVTIVRDSHFTPERIRKLIRDRLPELLGPNSTVVLTAKQIQEEVAEAIRNPTNRMQKAYDKLPSTHKWVLISLLEGGVFASKESVLRAVEAHLAGSRAECEAALDDLMGTFVRSEEIGETVKYIEWVHPSYRDLVIDELTEDPDARARFLETMSVNGIKLSLSEAGGKAGARVRPLLKSPSDWTRLRKSCERVARSENDQAAAMLLDVVNSPLRSSQAGPDRDEIQKIADAIIAALMERWTNDKRGIAIPTLRLWKKVADATGHHGPIPALIESWRAASEDLRANLDSTVLLEASIIDDWVAATRLLTASEALARLTMPEVGQDIEALISALNHETYGSRVPIATYEFASEADRLQTLAVAADSVAALDPASSARIRPIARSLHSLSEEYYLNTPREPDDDENHGGSGGGDFDFDVHGLFSDL